MKKLIFAIVLLLSMALVSYSKPANKDNGLVKGLTTALKSSQTTISYNGGSYKQASFNFNGKAVKAYYDAESDELIGFSIPMSVTDLPAGSAETIQNRFGGYAIEAMIMFVQRNGYFQFYVSLSRPKAPTIVVNITAKGKVHYYGKM